MQSPMNLRAMVFACSLHMVFTDIRGSQRFNLTEKSELRSALDSTSGRCFQLELSESIIPLERLSVTALAYPRT